MMLLDDKVALPISVQNYEFLLFSVGRLILTKSPGIRDEYGDRDAEDITHLYKNKEGTTAERLSVFNAVRGIDK